ncbi:carbon-nitrogen hydrolase family protein [Castellaniella sp. S9]|uniref:carbon-nitrogen hydrolase family protein n=1 Tax=Castellaniella sp. S9 TaxID=2993652 RepID=UPI003FA45040
MEKTRCAEERLFPVAAVQMVSGFSVEDNLARAGALIADAAAGGARLVVLPEYFCFMGARDADKIGIAETAGRGPIQEFLAAQARRHDIWLVGGTLPLQSPDADRIYNACLVFGPDGGVCARYDKVHLFSFRRGDESYDESVAIRPGDNAPQVFELPFGRTGLGICYDLRFPEFFRAQGDVRLMVLPAAFTYTTGSVHWEILLRARAIENQCYVLASAQGGKHGNGRRTWGHSMLVDPWGEVLGCLPEGEGVVSGGLDAGRLERLRESLPALRHRVM